jgi:hypothetical protein
MSDEVQETKWMMKVKGRELTIELPENFKVDDNVKEIPLDDFISIILQKNQSEGEAEAGCFPRIKHCCAKPPAGTKYSAGVASWCCG